MHNPCYRCGVKGARIKAHLDVTTAVCKAESANLLQKYAIA